MVSARQHNPYAAPHAHSSRHGGDVFRRPPTGWLCASSIALGLLYLIGAAMAWTDIVSIVFTGPVAVAFGVAVVAFGMKCAYRLAWVTGSATLLFVLFVFLLITINSWGPAAAQEPVSVVVVGWAIPAAAASFLTAFRAATMHSEHNRTSQPASIDDPLQSVQKPRLSTDLFDTEDEWRA